MDEVKKTLQISEEILKLAEEKGWSKEELAKAINLLHSEFTKEILI